jgi:hypothetical protein
MHEKGSLAYDTNVECMRLKLFGQIMHDLGLAVVVVEVMIGGSIEHEQGVVMGDELCLCECGMWRAWLVVAAVLAVTKTL